ADKNYLYVVSELAHSDEKTGFVHAFRINDGALTEISKLPTDGKAPCHLEIDKSGDFLLASNYVGGVTKLYHIATDGSLSVADKFQVPADLVPGRSSHLHSAKISPDNRTVAIADLGLDRIWLFELDTEQGILVPRKQAFLPLVDKAGPRHSVWSADGRFLYVINELNATVDVIEKAANEEMYKVTQTVSTLPVGWTGKNSCADIHLHPSGQYLYGSNRGHNSIVVFAIDQSSGRLTAIEHKGTRGDFPRNFAVSPAGTMLWVANQNTSNVSAFKISDKDGTLRFLWDYEVPTPVCLEF
ncbi:MAG: lactonase family protein, partial [Bacteroidota bacterium]